MRASYPTGPTRRPAAGGINIGHGPRSLLALAAALAALAASGPDRLPPRRAAEPLRPAASRRGRPPAGRAAPLGAPRAKPALPRGAVLEEVSGTVRELDRKAYQLEVDTPAGPVTLSLDRNTMVYTAAGLATVLDVKPGAQIRAGRNADFLAYWVQVRSPAKQEPPSTPGQGTGPAAARARRRARRAAPGEPAALGPDRRSPRRATPPGRRRARGA